MMRNGPATVRRFIAQVARQKRDKHVRNYRCVALRRPFGWTRLEFESFLRGGANQGFWTWSAPRDSDVAVLVVGDALLETCAEVSR
jgi:hypothetical protein